MSRLPWHITSAWQSLTWAKHSVSFNWHGAWYKPRVTICLFLIIARRGSNDQCQDNDLTSVLWAEAEQASLSFLIIARSGSNAQCQDNDLPQTFGPRRKEKSHSKTGSQSKWDAIYTRKSSCDLEIPIFFRCSKFIPVNRHVTWKFPFSSGVPIGYCLRNCLGIGWFQMFPEPSGKF